MSDRNYDFCDDPLNELVASDTRIEELEDELAEAQSKILRWIPVSERLPEDQDYCLVSLEDSLGLAWWHNEPTPKFIHEDVDNSWTPTHWMPLPEPPKVEL